MKSAAVLSLSRLVYDLKTDLEPSCLSEILLTVLLLLKEKAREIIKSVLGFLKVCIICLPPDHIEPHLPDLITGLTVWCGESKNRFRQKIKSLFEMLIKRFDVETIKSLVPTTYVKLIEHIKKTGEREAKKKAEAWAKHNKSKGMKDFDKLIEGDDMDGSDDDEEQSHGAGKEKGKQNKADKASAGAGTGTRGTKMWIKDADLNLLDADMNQHVVTSDPSLQEAVQTRKGGQDKRITQGADGKIHINPNRSRGKWAAMEDAKEEANEDDDDEDGEKPEVDADGVPQFYNKKKRRAGDGEEEKGGKRRKNETGARFKAKRAGGDIKGKGGVDPYAFVTLDPAQLNRRKRDKAAGRFESVVSAARKGANKGARAAKAGNNSRMRLKAKRKSGKGNK